MNLIHIFYRIFKIYIIPLLIIVITTTNNLCKLTVLKEVRYYNNKFNHFTLSKANKKSKIQVKKIINNNT